MALLEIIHLTGGIERRDLYKRQPMSIGSHPSNDLRIDEEGVEVMHARVSWNKDSWEVVAAGTASIELNGTEVHKARLRSGDTMRFGAIDVRFMDPDAPVPQEEPIGLKADSEEIKVAQKVSKSVPVKSPPVKKSDAELAKSLELLAHEAPATGKKASKHDEPLEVVDDEERPPARSSKTPPKAARATADDEVFEETPEDDSHASPARPGILDKVKDAIGSKPQRPGDMDPVKSPLVLGLLGGSILLVLIGLTFYFIADRRTTIQIYDEAVGLVDSQKYNVGIKALEEFVEYFPEHEKTPEALAKIGLAKVDQAATANSNYPEGLKLLREFVGQQRDIPGFDALKDQVATRAGDISLAAATLAGKQTNPGLFATVDSARTMLVTYSSESVPPTQKLREIDDARRAAERAINKTKDFRTKTEAIKQAIAGKQPMIALAIRRDLLSNYPDFMTHKEVRDLMVQTLELERSLVTSEEPATAAQTADSEILPAPKVLAFNARSRTDQVSENQVVWSLAKDCLYGVDTVTGLPVWRRAVGADLPFFPLEESSLPSLIVYDSERDELLRLNRQTGGLVWRQTIGVRVQGQPLLDGGQIYLTTEDHSLLKIDMQSGTIISQVKFSQPVIGPAVSGDEHLVVIGDQDVSYLLSRRPLACVGVSYLGQKAQSVQAPLVSMGPYVLFVENQSEQAATLRLLKQDSATTVGEVAQAPVVGMVVDEPVIRGRDLFVPSSVERVSAFSVSDTTGEKPLTVGPTFQVQGAQGSPIFLTPGPEGQVWMASSALRRLQLVADVIQSDSNVAAVGLSSQPIQSQGEYLFNARRRPFTDAVTLTQTLREKLTSDWQVITGAQLLATATFEGETPSLIAVNEAGATFRLTPAQLSESGFQTEAATRLPVDDATKDRLYGGALADSQIAVACSEPQARMWVINRLGLVDRQAPLPANPQGRPIPLGKKIVVPLVGRLHVARTGAGDTPVQDFQFPAGDQVPTWKQLLPVDTTNLIALTVDGTLLQIRQQQNPSPHLAEVTRITLPGPTIGEVAMFQGRFVVACGTGDVQLFDATKLEPIGRRVMTPAPSGPAYVTEAGVLIETGSDTLHCLNPDEGLTTKWKRPTEGGTLSGPPLMWNGQLILTFRDGQILTVDPQTGEPASEQWASGRLDSGPFLFSQQLFVRTWDGGLQRITGPAAP